MLSHNLSICISNIPFTFKFSIADRSHMLHYLNMSGLGLRQLREIYGGDPFLPKNFRVKCHNTYFHN